MISFLMKATTVLSALVQVVKAVVAIAKECKRAFEEFKNSFNKTALKAASTSASKEEVANTSTTRATIETKHVYPEVDLSVFEGKNFYWGPSLDTAFD